MRIEIANLESVPPKGKGDLFEGFAADLLRTQNYEVETQVRITATELDLLCRHRVNGRRLYVECKAHRDPLSANVLTNLLGVLTLKGYDEAWLISAGPLGKDAKGFKDEWEQKPAELRQRLSIYTPERVVEAFTSAFLIRHHPVDQEFPDDSGGTTPHGDWILLVTTNGRYWAAPTIQGGIPFGVLVYDARTGRQVTDAPTLREIGATDTSLRTLDFEFAARTPPSTAPAAMPIRPEKVVEIEHGDSWTDYRPARPQDFVGRASTQSTIFSLLEDVRWNKTATRIFAVTGDSGMGKSSLIAKIRDVSRNPRHRRKHFIYAVDCRAATNATYIAAALLKAIRNAAAVGFGELPAEDIMITDHSDPLGSRSILEFLESLERKKQVVCLVFDQFEELYSKPDLFAVFEEAQRLLLSAVSASASLVLGFAWRTDSTVQQDHPAYYMWHRLHDHRLEVSLVPFSKAETSGTLARFEAELGQKLRPEIRRQIAEISQGYPWLLKKICIHIFDQLESGVKQAELVETLDVASLFKRDQQQLTPMENTCLKMVAKAAPADWYEVLNASGPEVLRGLQDKRLIVRSGDRLNVYWDIFREYLLTGAVPSIPFSYIPSSPSLDSFLRVGAALSPEAGRTPAQLGEISGLGEKTVGNVIRDLRMFGIATGPHSAPRLDPEILAGDQNAVLLQLRRVLDRHSLTLALKRLDQGAIVTVEQLAALLMALNPAASHRPETWKGYAERMAQWLVAAGLVVPDQQTGWRREDLGRVVPPGRRRSRVTRSPFCGEAPPQRVVEVFHWLSKESSRTLQELHQAGYRNAVSVLNRWELLTKLQGGGLSVRAIVLENGGIESVVRDHATSEETLRLAVEKVRQRPSITGDELGDMIDKVFSLDWKRASIRRVGNALHRWAAWIMAGETEEERSSSAAWSRRKKSPGHDQGSLF